MTIEYLEDDYTPEEGDRQYFVDYVARIGFHCETEVRGIRIPVVGDADLSGLQIAQAVGILLHSEYRVPVWSVQICSIFGCTSESFVQLVQESSMNTETRFKSIFKSKTFWAIVAQFVIAIQPILAEWAQEGHSLERADLVRFGMLLATAAWGVYGRYAAKSIITTPVGLPGRSYPIR